MAKKRLEALKVEYKVIGEIKGKDIVGKEYVPPFDYYANNGNLENKTNAWKVYGNEFRTMYEASNVGFINVS